MDNEGIVYIVTAYRGGRRSEHSYTVGASLSAAFAVGLAKAEVDNRSGRYSCEVVAAKLLNHSPSDVYVPPLPKQVFYQEGELEAGRWSTNVDLPLVHDVVNQSRIEAAMHCATQQPDPSIKL